MLRRKRGAGSGSSSIVLSVVAVGSAFVVLPLVALLVYFGSHHAGPPTVSNLYQAVFNSVAASVIALVLVVITGIPIGYYLHTHRVSRRAHALATLLRLPLGVPPMVAGVMLLVAFGPESPIGRAVGGRLVNTLAAIVLAQCFASLPYVVEGSRGAFGGIDERARIVARSLGMGPIAQMTEVAIPLAWSSIRSSIILGYLRAFGEFGAVLLVAYSPYSLPVYTYVVFEGSGLGATAAPVLSTLALSGAIAFGMSRLRWPSGQMLRLLEKEPAGSGPEGSARRPAPDGSRISVKGTVGDFTLSAEFSAHRGCTVLLGPSGSGKTLTLNALCGSVTDGLQIEAGGEVGAMRDVAIGYVPQRFGLFPHLSVAENLRLAAAYGSEGRSPQVLLEEMGLSELSSRMPTSLSGGQYQRGALARAMAANACLVVLDEPLSALDAQMRLAHLRLIDTHVRQGVDYLFVVTHDVSEATYLADWLVVMEGGRVLQEGSASLVLASPSSIAVARIIGADNEVSFGRHLEVSAGLHGHTACFFSEDVSFHPFGEEIKDNERTYLGAGRVTSVRTMPWSSEVRFDLADSEIVARVRKGSVAALERGAKLGLSVPTERLFIY